MVQENVGDVSTVVGKKKYTGPEISVDNQNCKSFKTRSLAKSIYLWESSIDRRSATNFDFGIPKGCHFSPDGTCLLTARANKLELFNTPYEEEDRCEDDGVDNDGGDFATGSNVDIKTGGWEPVITCNSGESVRSYAWYPNMKSSDPASCCFLGVSRDSPVHLYDAYDGSIRATYRPYNGLDEMESPTTICFAENGQKIVTGGLKSDRILHIFDINRPGREHSRPLLRLGKTRRSKDGQKGLISAMASSGRNGVIAVGAYSPGSIYLYDLRAYSQSSVAEIVISSSSSTSFGGTICVSGHGKKTKKRKRFGTPDDHTLADACDDSAVHRSTTADKIKVNNPSTVQPFMTFSAAKAQWYHSRTRGGVTQLEFDNNDDNFLFSSSRRSNSILQWDLRKLSSSNFCPGIASFVTNNNTNQRIEFQVQGDLLWTGGTDGCVRVYSHRRPTRTSSSLLATINGFGDCVNGISLPVDTGLNPDASQARLEKLAVADSKQDEDGGDDDKIFNSLLAVAVGRRHFPSENDWENDDAQMSMRHRTNRFVGSTQICSLHRDGDSHQP